MHRIDGPGCTVDNKFTQGNPATGVQATDVTADWANAVQEEIAKVIEGAGIALNKSTNTQLYTAIQSIVLGSNSVARYFQTYSGDGTQTNFTLPVSPPSALACTIWVNGAPQIPTVAFTVSGTTLSFTGAPPAGTSNIAVMIEGSASEVSSQFPTGFMAPFAGVSAPTGWLLCDGSAVSRITYGALFGVIGTSFGSGDGTSTFNLPDARGRTLVGLDNLGGTAAGRITGLTSLGGNGGQQNVTPSGSVGNTSLTVAQLPSHNHGVTDPGHVHTQTRGTAGGALKGLTGQAISGTENTDYNTTSSVTGISINSTGSGDPHTHTFTGTQHTLLQPYVGVGFIIKA